MKGKKNKINLSKAYNNIKNIKIDKKKLKIIGAVVLTVILLITFACVKPLFYSKNIKKVQTFNIAEEYNIEKASKDAMKFVSWSDKKGIVTLKGKDRKTKEKVVIIFDVGENITFESMKMGDKTYEFNEWEDYMRSYKKD